MNQNQINEFILEALVNTEINTNRGICDLLIRKSKEHTNSLSKYLEVKDTFNEILITTCKLLGCYSNNSLFPIIGDWHGTKDKWDIYSTYGEHRHKVYDALVSYFQYETGITI